MGEFIPDTLMAGKTAVSALHETMHLALTVLAAGAASAQGSIDAFDQGGCTKGLGKETSGSGLQRAVADALFREGRDKDNRRVVTLGSHMQ
jgi:hypothetical protein